MTGVFGREGVRGFIQRPWVRTGCGSSRYATSVEARCLAKICETNALLATAERNRAVRPEAFDPPVQARAGSKEGSETRPSFARGAGGRGGGGAVPKGFLRFLRCDRPLDFAIWLSDSMSGLRLGCRNLMEQQCVAFGGQPKRSRWTLLAPISNLGHETFGPFAISAAPKRR